jgi:hypothetical protein
MLKLGTFRRFTLYGGIAIGLLSVGIVDAQPPIQRCGQPMTTPPPVTIWVTDYDTRAVKIATLGDNALDAPDNFDPPSASRPEQRVSWDENIVTVDGQTLLSLRSNPDGVDAINVFSSGRQSTLVNTNPDLEWWKIAPGPDPESFSVFAYDNQTNAYWIDATFSQDEIVLNDIRSLPFTFYLQSFYSDSLYLSPDGDYVAYFQTSRTDDTVLEFFIYSLEDERFIWTTPHDGDSRVKLIWTKVDQGFIALVWGATAQSATQIIGVSVTGNTEPLFDLSTAFGEITFTSASGIAAGSRYTPFWLDSRLIGNSRLVAYDHQANQLIDLCITTIATQIHRTPDSEYVAFQIQNAIPTEYLIVEVATGDTYPLIADRTQILGISLDE